MAYTDFLARRKWLFDLRLSQLSHIFHSTVSLDEILRSQEEFAKKKVKSGIDGENESDEEISIIKPLKEKGQIGNVDEDDPEYDGVATNPLVDVTAGGPSPP